MMRRRMVCVLRADDVGKRYVRRGGYTADLDSCIGRVQDGDVGKAVWLVGNALRVESEAERAARRMEG